jgi:hypothetical protein
MIHFFNLLIVLILTVFGILIGYLQYLQEKSVWYLLFIPWVISTFLWGSKLFRDYDNSNK